MGVAHQLSIRCLRLIGRNASRWCLPRPLVFPRPPQVPYYDRKRQENKRISGGGDDGRAGDGMEGGLMHNSLEPVRVRRFAHFPLLLRRRPSLVSPSHSSVFNPSDRPSPPFLKAIQMRAKSSIRNIVRVSVTPHASIFCLCREIRLLYFGNDYKARVLLM